MYDEPIVTPEALLAELAAAGAPRGAAAFDFDGTLAAGDAGLTFFRSLLERRAIRREAGPRLAEELAGAGAPVRDDPHQMAEDLLDLYYADRYPESAICEVMAYAVAGYHEREASALAEAAFDPSTIYAGARDLVQDLARAGYEVWIVSGSPRVVVEVGARHLGVSAARVLAMTPIVDGGGVVQPRVARPATYRGGKVEALRAAGVAHVAVAFGDTRKDIELLESADVRVAVCPRPALRALATGPRWRVLWFARTVGGMQVVPNDDDRVFPR